MLREIRFTEGLLAFLIAHIFYILALISISGFLTNFTMLISVIIFFIFFVKVILPHTGDKKFYVLIYSIIIMLLLWQSISRMFLEFNNSSLFLGLGIILFTISDTVLAYNKFVKRVKYSQVIILLTYYIAQLFIAVSV